MSFQQTERQAVNVLLCFGLVYFASAKKTTAMTYTSLQNMLGLTSYKSARRAAVAATNAGFVARENDKGGRGNKQVIRLTKRAVKVLTALERTINA